MLIFGSYNYEMPALKDIAAKRGYAYEDMLLHMGVNYTLKPGIGWAMGRFDSCDDGTATTARTACSCWTTMTRRMSTNSMAAWKIGAADVRITKRVLFGYCEPFDEATFTSATPAGSGIWVAWEYWNGPAWAPYAGWDETDGSETERQSAFMTPANWAMKAENGSAQRSGGSV